MQICPAPEKHVRGSIEAGTSERVLTNWRPNVFSTPPSNPRFFSTRKSMRSLKSRQLQSPRPVTARPLPFFPVWGGNGFTIEEALALRRSSRLSREMCHRLAHMNAYAPDPARQLEFNRQQTYACTIKLCKTATLSARMQFCQPQFAHMPLLNWNHSFKYRTEGTIGYPIGPIFATSPPSLFPSFLLYSSLSLSLSFTHQMHQLQAHNAIVCMEDISWTIEITGEIIIFVFYLLKQIKNNKSPCNFYCSRDTIHTNNDPSSPCQLIGNSPVPKISAQI